MNGSTKSNRGHVQVGESTVTPALYITHGYVVIKEVHGINDNDKQFIVADLCTP